MSAKYYINIKMFNKVFVSDRVFWIGVNDRRKNLFENIWPLPEGVSYNSYIIVDEKTALIDTEKQKDNW